MLSTKIAIQSTRPRALLRALRASKFLDQHGLAIKAGCGLTQPRITDLERGKLMPTRSEAEALADALDSDVAVLFPEFEEQDR